MADQVRKTEDLRVTAGAGTTVGLSTDADPAAVWAVLADGFRYPGWVVGTSHMRAVDDSSPDREARLHHASGAWPFLVEDVTEVESSQPRRSLVLLAKVRPLGEARVSVRLAEEGSGCRITMTEDAVSPAARSLVPAWVRHHFLAARNTESLRRLAALAERRSEPD